MHCMIYPKIFPKPYKQVSLITIFHTVKTLVNKNKTKQPEAFSESSQTSKKGLVAQNRQLFSK